MTEGDLSRRDLLRRGAVAGAAATLPDLSVLAGSAFARAGGLANIRGAVVRPGDHGYAKARADWDGLFSSYPLAIAFCSRGQDVVDATTWARRRDVAIRVRSGRHHLEGWSNLSGGLVIDVSRMKRVRIDAVKQTATIGAGITQSEAVAALGKHGFAIPTGSEATVGVVGATLGGGFGFFTRSFGMACDNLVGVRIAVPEGRRRARLISADERRNRDLLWACRGGGGGNFGIVTSLTFRLNPIGNVVFLFAKWPDLENLDAVFDAWQKSAPYADERLTSVLEVDPGAISLFAVLQSDSADEARRLLDPVLSIAGPSVSTDVKSWPEVFADLNSGPRQFANWKFFSQFITKPFPGRAIEIVGDHMSRAPSPPSNFFCSAFGGAVREEPSRGTAFPHRRALFYAEPGAGWNGDDLTPQALTWVAEFSQALRPYVDGAYVNVPNAAMADWETAYYAGNYPRLRRIKTNRDPHNVFQFEQSIRGR